MTDRPFDPTKPYRCRNGAEAVIMERKIEVAPGVWRIFVRIRPDNGSWFQATRYLNGRFVLSEESSTDLINVPTKREEWVNYYGHSERAFAYPTKEKADRWARTGRIACFHREWEE